MFQTLNKKIKLKKFSIKNFLRQILSSKTGFRCHFLNPCLNKTCHNDGKCVVIWPDNDVTTSRYEVIKKSYPDRIPSWKCDCKDGFIGENCTTVSFLVYNN